MKLTLIDILIICAYLLSTIMVIFPIYIVLKKMVPLCISIAIVAVCFIILKKTWWNRLPDDKPTHVPAGEP